MFFWNEAGHELTFKKSSWVSNLRKFFDIVVVEELFFLRFYFSDY